jgi:hypothetical protein
VNVSFSDLDGDTGRFLRAGRTPATSAQREVMRVIEDERSTPRSDRSGESQRDLVWLLLLAAVAAALICAALVVGGGVGGD